MLNLICGTDENARNAALTQAVRAEVESGSMRDAPLKFSAFRDLPIGSFACAAVLNPQASKTPRGRS